VQPDRVQAATCAFPLSFGTHISAIPLGDATFLAMSELPLFVPRHKSSGSTGTGVRRVRGVPLAGKAFYCAGPVTRMRQVTSVIRSIMAPPFGDWQECEVPEVLPSSVCEFVQIFPSQALSPDLS